MIIVLKPDAADSQIRAIEREIARRGNRAVRIEGRERFVLAVVGAVRFEPREIEDWPGVSAALRVSKPYKLASREVKRDDTVVRVGDVEIGGDRIVVIAGPCSVENRAMLLDTAERLAAMGVTMLRGGAYKPRTSPYAFQGLGEEGLRILAEARRRTGLRIVTEVMSPERAKLVAKYADVLQIGARNMQNFDLLRAVAKVGRPVLLKRGFANSIEEWLMAAEYILAYGHGTPVILCERGIRTFETATRNTLDLNAIPVVKALSHLPIVVDPSHGTGVRAYVGPLSKAAVGAGADGLILEVHPDPDRALSDGAQSLTPDQLARLLRDLEAIAPVVGRRLDLSTRAPAVPRAPRGRAPSKAAYQGVPGAFSERAARQIFGPTVAPDPCATFEEVFARVATGRAAWGVVPVENTLAGSVHPNWDLLVTHPVSVVGELKLRVVHCLIGPRGAGLDDVRTVHAHPQAAAQCARFLRAHPRWSVFSSFDTAGSVREIAEKGARDEAAIASAEAAERYGMAVLAEGIEDDPQNYTRFLVIARKPGDARRGDKVSLAYQTRHAPGALAGTLAALAKRGINLTKLESRPIPGRPWEYLFYVDFEGSLADRKVKSAVAELRRRTTFLKVLGCYPAAR